MTEKKIWLKIHDWLPGYKVRLENSISSGLPDVLWIPKLPIFLELKVKSGNNIIVRNSQIVFGRHIKDYILPEQHLFVVEDVASPPFFCYTYNTIIKCPSVFIGESRQKVRIEGIDPDFIWIGAINVSNYLKLLEERERNGRLNRVSSESK